MTTTTNNNTRLTNGYDYELDIMAITRAALLGELFDEIADVTTFEEYRKRHFAAPTDEQGLIIRMEDSGEFQITIRRTK